VSDAKEKAARGKRNKVRNKMVKKKKKDSKLIVGRNEKRAAVKGCYELRRSDWSVSAKREKRDLTFLQKTTFGGKLHRQGLGPRQGGKKRSLFGWGQNQKREKKHPEKVK